MSPIEELIEARLGLSRNAVGPDVIDRAIGRRMAARGLTDRALYAAYAGAHSAEWEALLEELVVLETWFFRIPEAFTELVRFAGERRRRPEAPLRIASLPCATGEEPYSIAMALLDAGFPSESFQVDAADISSRALCRAQAGVFGEAAFRGKHPEYQQRFFDPVGTGYQLHAGVRERVRFLRGNLLDPCLLAGVPPYDILFCRNLVIYLSARARERAVAAVDRLLAPRGILFVGHAEADIFRAAGFVRTCAPRAFACRRPRRVARARAAEPAAAPAACGMPPLFPPIPPAAAPAPTAPPPETSPPPADPPFHGEDRLGEAGRMADSGDLPGALARCREYLDAHPTDPQAHFLAGMIHQSMGDDLTAESHFERTVYLDPTHHDALWQLALGAERRGERPRADRLRARARRVREREGIQ